MKYTKEQIATALQLLDSTGSPRKVIEILGYPSNPMLYHWRKKYPELYTSPQMNHWKQASPEFKLEIIQRCFIDGENVKSVSEEETINVLKKDPGVDQTALKNREKAVIIDALKSKYSLSDLCKKLSLPRSSYYYQETVMRAEDKYLEIRKRIVQLFHMNRNTFGYRKIHMLLHNEGIIVSEKVVRRIMRQEQLIVKQKRTKKYNSYKGEITPAVENIINRDFHAEKPNQKWITDITEFSIKSGKVYLSPIIDCLDGMPVSWTIGTSPNAELTNTMLRKAIATLSPDEKPIVHSDRGCHYRWPEWIKIMDDAGLTRSMSRKGCSPDNSACEGFFGHLKTEMFYGYNWDDYSIDEFIQEVNDYMQWYCRDRIKTTLGGLSPLDYRRSIGVRV